jgi:REP element-mobilizing transposase RayT
VQVLGIPQSLAFPRILILSRLDRVKKPSRTMKKDFSEQVNKFYKGEVSFWSNSYYVASSGGAPIEKLKDYIKNQDAPNS